MKYVNMTDALRQVREKAPDTADAMKRHKAGNAGFTDKAHLKAKGLIPRACLLYTSPSPRDKRQSRMPSSA